MTSLARLAVGALCATLLGGPLAACGGGARYARDDERTVLREARQQGRAYADFVQAEMLAERGAMAEAIAAYRSAIQADPTAALPHLRLAAAMRIGGTAGGEALTRSTRDEALHQVNLAEQLGVPAADAAIERALIWQANGDIDAALDALLPAQPYGDADVYERCYLIANEVDRTADMVRCTTAYIATFPERPLAWRYHGFALRADEQLQDAADAFAYATTLPNADPRDAVDQITTLEELGDYDAAIGAAIACRGRFRDHVECYAHEALLRDVHREDGAPLDDATLDALDRLTARAAGNTSMLWRARRVMDAEARPALIVGLAEEIARQRPYNEALLTQAAWLCARAERNDDAVRFMERVLELDDANFDALNFIGYTWADAGVNLEQAEAYIRQAVFLRPDSGGILDSLAWVLYRTEQYEEALEVQLEAVELDGDSGVLWDHLGDIYMALGRYAEAADAYERALEIATAWDEDVLETVPDKLREARERAGD